MKQGEENTEFVKEPEKETQKFVSYSLGPSLADIFEYKIPKEVH